MTNKQKLQEFLGYLAAELNAREADGIEVTGAGVYGEDGHVGDHDEDIVGMIWMDEADTGRVWNLRLTLDS